MARLTVLEATDRRATRRDRLARAGVVKLGKGRVRRMLQTVPEGQTGGAEVLAALLAERGEGR